jgi:hypothetical protein
MRRIALVVVAVTITAVAGVAAYMESASGQSNGDAAPIYGVKLPEGYRDWRLISVKRLTGKQLTGLEECSNSCVPNWATIWRSRPTAMALCRSRMAQSLPRCIGMKTRRILTTKLWPPVFLVSTSNLLSPGPPLTLNSWSRTQKNTPRPAAGDLPTSQRANLVTRRCTQSASRATRLQKTMTTFSLATHLRPGLNNAPILGGINFFNPQGWQRSMHRTRPGPALLASTSDQCQQLQPLSLLMAQNVDGRCLL